MAWEGNKKGYPVAYGITWNRGWGMAPVSTKREKRPGESRGGFTLGERKTKKTTGEEKREIEYKGEQKRRGGNTGAGPKRK